MHLGIILLQTRIVKSSHCLLKTHLIVRNQTSQPLISSDLVKLEICKSRMGERASGYSEKKLG